MTLKSINPSNNQILGEVKISTKKDIKSAVAKAKKSQSGWQAIGAKERVKYLKKLYQILKQNADQIALHDTQNMGFPISQCHDFNLGDGLNYFKWYLDNAATILASETTFEDNTQIHQVHYEPYGVAAVIQPWNFPFCQWSWSVVPTLLAGNTVVYKPAEDVSYSNQFLESLINQAGLPAGVHQFIYGDGKTGDFLVHQEISLIVFTGSTATGQYLYQVAAEKFIPILLELGGSAPGIIFDDANLDEAIEAVFWQRFSNCGQTCDGLKRLIVHHSIFDQVVDQLLKKLQTANIGDPTNPDTVFGPVATQRQLELLESQVADGLKQGAKVMFGGQRAANQTGAYYQPTILTHIKPTMRVWQEEVFGPVLPIVSFKTEAEAIKLANDTQYGLGSYVYTYDKDRAARVAAQIKAGMVSVNGLNYVLPHNPFGGYKKSGLGRAHGKWGLHELSQKKLIARPK